MIDTHTRDWYTHTRTHIPTDAADDDTRRPKLASNKNVWKNEKEEEDNDRYNDDDDDVDDGDDFIHSI